MLRQRIGAVDGESRNALSAFLLKCQATAQRKGCSQVGSIALALQLKDPLAILKSVRKEGDPYFYLEHPLSGEATAGGQALFYQQLEGPGRFAAARSFAQSIVDKALVMDDARLPFSGLRFLCGFSFFNTVSAEAGFPSTAIFVPRWLVTRRGANSGVVFNVKVEPQSDLAALEDEVWTLFERFSALGRASLKSPLEGSPAVFKASEVGEKGRFEAIAREALDRIERGCYNKIVLARAVDLENQERSFDPFYSLNNLRGRFPDCFAFALNLGNNRSFIGSTPESLVRLKGNAMETAAVAGSAPRGHTGRHDRCLAKALLDSEKNVLEHQVVIDSICRRLQSIGMEPKVASQPQLLCLPNVQHLQSPIHASVPRSVHLMDMVEALHPTPAVGGTPWQEAQRDIRRLENFDRGLYAGTIGWLDHRGDGEMMVAIRSALISGRQARIYAGAGIVRGSEPQREKQETDLKLRAMLEAIS